LWNQSQWTLCPVYGRSTDALPMGTTSLDRSWMLNSYPIFKVSSYVTNMEFFLTVIGVVMVVEGMPWFLSPQGVKKMLLQILPLPEHIMRSMGLVLMLAGLAMVYIASNYFT